MRRIAEVADDLGIPSDALRPYGPYVAKVPVPVVRERAARGQRGKLVLVTGITPTKHGEGKTVTTIGAAMGLRRIGRSAVAVLRQPSLGPVFGAKGGASGGGQATVEPAADVNLGLTGDLDAVSAAHNLLAAMVDNHLYHGNPLHLDRGSLLWPRTLDVEDRALRRVLLVPPTADGDPPRESRFVIAAASEVTAILGLSVDYADLKRRLGRLLVGSDQSGRPVRADDLRATGSMAALLREALAPNLLQTADGTPAVVHGGPFANIAHGTASRLGIELALYSAEYCVVEAGFASELGAEKFVDILGRDPALSVDAGILVATVRALRRQGGIGPDAVDRPDPAAVERGLPNLAQHLENLRELGVETVVALNRHPSDDAAEVALIRRAAEAASAPFVVSDPFSGGAEGARALAEAVVATAGKGTRSEPLYPDGTPLVDAIDTIATRLYGAESVVHAPDAIAQRDRLEALGETSGPVCIAKTQYSLSDDAHRIGRPRGYACTVRRLTRSAGAGFTVAYMGDVEMMPGLPTRPLAEQIGLTDDGVVTGLH